MVFIDYINQKNGSKKYMWEKYLEILWVGVHQACRNPGMLFQLDFIIVKDDNFPDILNLPLNSPRVSAYRWTLPGFRPTAELSQDLDLPLNSPRV